MSLLALFVVKQAAWLRSEALTATEARRVESEARTVAAWVIGKGCP